MKRMILCACAALLLGGCASGADVDSDEPMADSATVRAIDDDPAAQAEAATPK